MLFMYSYVPSSLQFKSNQKYLLTPILVESWSEMVPIRPKMALQDFKIGWCKYYIAKKELKK